MPPVGPVELGLLALVVLMVFGAGKLTHLGGALGKSVRDFRREAGGTDRSENTQ